MDKAESVQLEEAPLQTFDEIFGEGCLDKLNPIQLISLDKLNPIQLISLDKLNPIQLISLDKLNPIQLISLDKLNPIQLISLDKLNPIQLISLDKLNPIQLISLDKLNPIQLISLDKLNPIQLISLDKLNPIQLISLDKLNPIQLISLDKLNPIQLISLDKLNQIQLIRILLSQKKFDQMKAELKRTGFKNSHQNEINETVAKELGITERTICNWKSELGQTIAYYGDEDIDGFKNSYNELDKTVAKELGLSFRTIFNWQREFGQTKPNHKYSHSEQKELMKLYYEIKDQKPKISNENIAKMLKIGTRTLYKWKKLFKRQQFHPKLFMDILWKR
uniref:Uncharacterized protein n=1 Tax=Globodera rostochiensis TaxID=31243 RepID=A0A914H9R7_GLORO